MNIKYDITISDSAIKESLKKILNRVYKLLPSREENLEWQKPLDTIIEELAGMQLLMVDRQEDFFILLCKLEGLRTLTRENDFSLFRRIIFECLNLLGQMRESL